MGADHDHQYGHARDHGHDHHHAPADYGRAFLIGIGLNFGFCVFEAIYGLIANSMALIADAGHNLSDVLGLIAGWIAVVLARRAPSRRFTYGLKRASVLAALFNAVLLLVATGAIAVEAMQRLQHPQGVAAVPMMIVAAIGIGINGVTAWLFARGTDDLNVRSAFVHMLADATLSAGVVIAGLVILKTGVTIIDPVASLIIAAVIVWGTWGLLRDSVSLSLDAVPAGVDMDALETDLAAIPGVDSVHHLHVWPLSTTDTAVTGHLHIVQGSDHVTVLSAATQLLRARKLTHSTIQIETGICVEEHEHHH